MAPHRPRIDCGSLAGFLAHEVRGEAACPRCLDASAWSEARLRLASKPEHPVQYRAAVLGREPADALTTSDRARLVTELHAAGRTDLEVAQHTRMTTFTAAEIRGRLGLPPNRPRRDTREGAA